ncbi:hypothetical protein QE250_10365 [Chromatiaceae bacterium AAb-1]|nr:hypothetical protein [Chromatiaceae bacterium AAb-1]
MTAGTVGKSNYTKAIRTLIDKIYDNNVVAGSLYEQAALWFRQEVKRRQQQRELEHQVLLLRQRQHQVSKRDIALVEQRLQQAQEEQKHFSQQQLDENHQRYLYLKELCREILALTQGDSFTETNLLTAKLLGTIQLSSPTQGKQVAASNQKSKHLYKAALSLRLLDRLLADKELHNPFILQRHNDSRSRTNLPVTEYHPFRDDVQMPLLMAVLLQEIGTMHPDAQLILKGEDGKADEFRALDDEQRIRLLQISFRETLNYVTNAIGIDRYVGNSREEREQFIHHERERQAFILGLLKNAVKPEHGIGNLLKIPQVYSSVVLSTKHNYVYDALPKAALVLEKGVEKGLYSHTAVTAMLRITGIFPQGFGITYIPKDSDKQDLDRYEYAIVTSLYPADPRVPVCRMVTRNLTYNVSAQGCTVSTDNNLYFPQARKKLEKISEERLLEILSKLVSNFEERKSMALIPGCWHPDEYFSFIKNQNLWNKVVVLSN